MKFVVLIPCFLLAAIVAALPLPSLLAEFLETLLALAGSIHFVLASEETSGIERGEFGSDF